MKALCKKCGSPSEVIKRSLLRNNLKGYSVVCLKCKHVEIIHKDEKQALEKLPLEKRVLL